MAREDTTATAPPFRRIDDILAQQGMPSNLEAERALLGAVLVNNDLADEILESIRAEDLASPGNQRIFRALHSMRLENLALDTVTLTERLHRTGELDAVGGPEYISDLVTGMSPLSSAEHYVRIIKDRALLRELIVRANKIALDAYTSPEDPAQILAMAEQSILEVGTRNIKTTMVGMPELAAASYETFSVLVERKENVTGIATHFNYLDQMTSGLQPSDLIVLAARPAVGKTAFALSLALSAAKAGKIVAFFSLEMSAEQIFFRLLSMESRIDLKDIRSGHVSKAQQSELSIYFNALGRLPMMVDDSPTLSLLDMGAKSRRLRKSRGLDLVLVDYLQLMRGIGRSENRNQEVSAISRGLKAAAKEFQIPLLALSQLSRAPEKRGEGKEPILSDLRDSGSIEQDADIVLFLHRNTAAGKDDPETRGKAKLIVAKQRNGPTGSERLTFLAHLAQFANFHQEFPDQD